MARFLIRCLVSVLRFHESKGRIRGKSLADTANIPVFRRRRSETGFDLHCVATLALDFGPTSGLDCMEFGSGRLTAVR